jgi:transcriptional regulator with XRE-family HTH domain
MGVSKEDRFQKQLGERIDAIRQEQGISFAEMSLRCDIDKSILVKITKGANTTVSTLYKISKGLNVPLSKIFDF